MRVYEWGNDYESYDWDRRQIPFVFEEYEFQFEGGTVLLFGNRAPDIDLAATIAVDYARKYGYGTLLKWTFYRVENRSHR